MYYPLLKNAKVMYRTDSFAVICQKCFRPVMLVTCTDLSTKFGMHTCVMYNQFKAITKIDFLNKFYKIYSENCENSQKIEQISK